ncbi:hypothetical protein DFJ74DRAFT_445363 [Hyaloraphidium curvatum]|nr:hypothetical protein DFJ74DRAFT_445363 [Hyaloraphidium curvatum]
MTSKIVRNKTTFGRPYFEPCADFDLRNHFAEVPLVVEGEQTPEAAELALGLLCGKLMAEGNDWDARPPWKMYHISGMILPGGKTGSAMFWKLHHALGECWLCSACFRCLRRHGSGRRGFGQALHQLPSLDWYGRASSLHLPASDPIHFSP